MKAESADGDLLDKAYEATRDRPILPSSSCCMCRWTFRLGGACDSKTRCVSGKKGGTSGGGESDVGASQRTEGMIDGVTTGGATIDGVTIDGVTRGDVTSGTTAGTTGIRGIAGETGTAAAAGIAVRIRPQTAR